MENPFTGDPLNGRMPVELSTYLQDKIESDDIVVNIGARYDYFDSQFWVLNDSEDPNYMSPVKPINRWQDTDGDGLGDNSDWCPRDAGTSDIRDGKILCFHRFS